MRITCQSLNEEVIGVEWSVRGGGSAKGFLEVGEPMRRENRVRFGSGSFPSISAISQRRRE